MLLSVIIPARNEGKRLHLALEALASHSFEPSVRLEVVVVDAGSTDDTAAVAEGFRGRLPGLRVLRIDNTGRHNNKGAALRTGMLAASGDLRCFIDADNGAPFEQIDTLLPLTADHDVVIGSRYVPGGDPGPRGVARKIISRGGNRIFRSVLHLRQLDTHCPLKLFSADAAELLFGLSRIDGLGFDAEVLVIATRRGLRVAEVPVTWRHVENGTLSVYAVMESLAEVGRIRRNLRDGLYDVMPVPPGS